MLHIHVYMQLNANNDNSFGPVTNSVHEEKES